MAVTGVFTADFSSFNTEVKKAEGALKSFEGNSAKVEKQLQEMGEAADGSAPQINSLRESTSQFDGVLSAMGININKQVNALEDIGKTSGKTAGQVGLLGTAGLAVGTWMAAWEFGRAIAETLKLDAAIGNATASLMGWGNVVEETLGARQDVFNKAWKDGADLNIKFADAVKFNAATVAQAAADSKDWTGAMAAAKEELKSLTQAQIDGIDAAKQMGATQEQITLKYGISKEALKFFTAEMKTSDDITKSNEQQLDKLAQQLERNKEKRDAATGATQGHSAATTANTQAVDRNAAAEKAYREELERTKKFLDAREASLDAIKTKAEEAKAANDAFMNAPTLNDREAQSVTSDIPRLTGFALDEVLARFHQAGDRDPNAALYRGLATLEAQEGRYNVTDNKSFFDMQRDTLLLAQLRQLLGGGGRPPGFASGVENFPGGLAYVHKGEALVNLPAGTDVIPAGGGRGASVTNVTLNLSGVIGNRQEIGNYLSEILVDRFRSFGYRGPVPFGA